MPIQIKKMYFYIFLQIWKGTVSIATSAFHANIYNGTLESMIKSELDIHVYNFDKKLFFNGG